MSLTYRRHGRSVSSHDFLKGLRGDMMNADLTALADEMHRKVAAVVDPDSRLPVRASIQRAGRPGPTSVVRVSSGRSADRNIGPEA